MPGFIDTLPAELTLRTPDAVFTAALTGNEYRPPPAPNLVGAVTNGAGNDCQFTHTDKTESNHKIYLVRRRLFNMFEMLRKHFHLGSAQWAAAVIV